METGRFKVILGYIEFKASPGYLRLCLFFFFYKGTVTGRLLTWGHVSLPFFKGKSPHLPHPEDTPEGARTLASSELVRLSGVLFPARVDTVAPGFWGLTKEVGYKSLLNSLYLPELCVAQGTRSR